MPAPAIPWSRSAHGRSGVLELRSITLARRPGDERDDLEGVRRIPRGGLPAAWLIGLAALDGLAIAAWAQVSARALLAPITAGSSKTHFEIGADEIVSTPSP